VGTYELILGKATRHLRINRYILALVGVWTVLIGMSLTWYLYEQHRHSIREAEVQARANLEKDIVLYRWATDYGGIYVPVTEESPPNPFLSRILERDIKTTSGRLLTMANPLYLMHLVHGSGREKYAIRGRITSLDPLNPRNVPDSWEAKALRAFERGKTEVISVEQKEGRSYLRLMLPLITERGCLKCHPAQGHKEGDILGGIGVSVPIAPIMGNQESQNYSAIIGYIVLWVLGFAGIVVGVRRIGKEIRERVLSETAVRELYERLAFNIEHLPMGYIVWDKEFRVQEWNPASEIIFGWTAGEAIEKHACELMMPPKAQPCVIDVLANLLESGEASHSVNDNTRKDGTKITCEWFIVPRHSASREITGVLSMVHDITEKVQLEKQLQVAQRMEAVGTLAGGIAHDFNNVLTVIIGYGEMLKLRIANDPKAISDLDEILRGAERASVLTRQLLTFARRQVVELNNIDLNRVVIDLEKLLRKVTRENIEIKTFPAECPVMIRADRGQVEQVLMNLCLNARDAMPEGGQLVIETGVTSLEDGYLKLYPYMKAGRYAVLSVSDTGIGMDEKTRERIFEPFFTTKGPDKGTGLGLAVVYGIVKQHNGFIHVYSEPGMGTTFRVYFPEVDAPADAKVIASQGEAQGGSETILLAEDNESVRNLTEKTLSSYGYRVLIACDGEEAVGIFLRHHNEIAMAVLDVVMPKMGGKQAYEEMAKILPGLKVLFLSGYSANASHNAFVLRPGLPFLQKPFGPSALARKVREALDRK
jgi:two-component system, cell cycle sensor histidine kinase and response regulator CckA